jgi:hypothetical protein
VAVRVEINGRRHYQVQPGVFVPSVTTVLGATSSPKDQAVLSNWLAKNPGGREAAAARGTAIHAACEDYIRGRPVSVPAEIQCFWDGLARHLDTYDGFLWSEVPLLPEHRHLVDEESGIAMVYSLEYRYAGVPDLIALRNGAHFLVDFKTSNGPYCRFFPKADSPEVIDAGGTFGGWKKYQKCATQLAAYKIAIKETLGIDIHRVEILTSTPEITQRFQIHGPELKKFECRWLQKVRAYQDLVAEETAAAEAGLTLEEYRASEKARPVARDQELVSA